MTAVLRLDLLDSRFLVQGPPALLAELADLFPRVVAAADPLVHVVVVDALDVLLDGALEERAPGPTRLPEAVLMVLNRQAVADLRDFAVHSGAVAVSGGVIAWPGVSGAGKSTLTGACLQAGFDYVSDEALVLADGRVRSYPKPLSLSAWSLAALGLEPPRDRAPERPVHPRELGEVAAGLLEVRHLVVLDRRPGHASLAPVPAGGLAALLLRHSFNHYKDGARSFSEATRAAGQAQCWRLRYDRPADGAAALRATLG